MKAVRAIINLLASEFFFWIHSIISSSLNGILTHCAQKSFFFRVLDVLILKLNAEDHGKVIYVNEQN